MTDYFVKYVDCLKSLKETSKDTANQEYMTNCEGIVFDFDSIKQEYTKCLSTSYTVCKSCDALKWDDKHKILIEFKNGNFNNKEIKDKIQASLLLLCDIVNTNISKTREELDFILVYDKDVKLLTNDEKELLVQESSSRVEIGGILGKLAHTPLVRFDLEKYKGFYFKHVLTLTGEEFESWVEASFVS